MVDWDKPLETVDGIEVRLRWPNGPHPNHKREVFIGNDPASRTYYMDGVHYAREHPDIRNVATQPSPDLQARCVALVERMADGMDAHADGPSRFCMQDYKEARAIMDEMRPVDPDLIEARKCAAQAQLTSVAEVTRRGGMDDQPIVIAARAALRRGRALERGE